MIRAKAIAVVWRVLSQIVVIFYKTFPIFLYKIVLSIQFPIRLETFEYNLLSLPLSLALSLCHLVRVKLQIPKNEIIQTC